MRHGFLILTAICLAAAGCGDVTEPTTEDMDTAAAHAGPPAEPAETMPDDEIHAKALRRAKVKPLHSGGGINAEVTLDPEIAADWAAVTVRVVETATGAETDHEIPVGASANLGDTGLTVEVVTFVPDFVMDETGITSRSAEPLNPAARVVISETGKDDYRGWLFGAMPEIHPYEHPDYRVLLVEGIPAS